MWPRMFMTFMCYVTPAFFVIHGFVDYYSDYLWSLTEGDSSNVYDFIIVGAGSAGSTVAHRLSSKYRVLLLEAGGDPHTFHRIPGFALDLLNRPEWDWQHETVPQKHAGFGLKNNVSFWARGKVLGGSSTLNYMMYLRGHPQDYDNWAKLTKDPEWSYKNVLPYFKKSIKHYKGRFKDNSRHYSESPYGFLNVETMRWSPFLEGFIAAGKELGYREIDANGPQAEGFGPIEVTQRLGQRWGTYAAIVKNLLNKPNVKVSKYSQATKIKFDTYGRAVGVYYLRHGRPHYATATKEVIVSGGSIDSPKLLMNSGIGPADHLKDVGVVADLPVGKNLEDHVTTALLPFSINRTDLVVNPDRDFGISLLYDMYANGRGPLTASGSLVGQSFLCSNKLMKNQTSVPCTWPDLQLYFAPLSFFALSQHMLTRASNVRPEFINALTHESIGKDGFYFVVALVRPQSKGTITLKDSNPLSPLIIDPNYLADPRDLKTIVTGVKFAMEIAEKTRSFREIGAEYSGKQVPGCSQHKFRSDDYWRCYVRHFLLTIWHPTGTCKMGSDQSDKTAVVDSKLRVLKMRGLRVADASIMPVIVNANTNAPSIMIGEKAAAFIQQYWSDQLLVSDSVHYYFHRQTPAKCFYLKTASMLT